MVLIYDQVVLESITREPISACVIMNLQVATIKSLILHAPGPPRGAVVAFAYIVYKRCGMSTYSLSLSLLITIDNSVTFVKGN